MQSYIKGISSHTKFLLNVIIWFLSFQIGLSQDFVSVNSFKMSEYGGGNQNWDISIDQKGWVYVANNDGLLVLDGSGSKLYTLPVPMIVRSVAAIGNRIYTGSYEELGYWEYGQNAELSYTSLVPLMKDYTFQNEEIWRIVEASDGKVYFHSFGAIFCLDNKQLQTIPTPGLMQFLIRYQGRIFTQKVGGGLFEIKNRQLEKIEGSDLFEKTEVKAILPGPSGEMLICTSSMGLYLFDGHQFKQWMIEAENQLIQSMVNNGIRLGDKIILGTILNGVYILNIQGKITGHLNSGNFIQNNTILSLCGDAENNLWLAMDKGVDFVSFKSPIEVFKETEVSIGMVYTAAMFQNKLYLGTNQGVYIYSSDREGHFVDRHFLPNSQGQVWFLKEIEGKLYCGMNSGTYIIENENLVKMNDVSGGYNLIPVENHRDDIMLQSTYSNLTVYSKTEGKWLKSHAIDGFSAPSRYLAIDPSGMLFVGHTIRGLHMLEPNADWNSFTSVKEIGVNEGINTSVNHVFRVDNRILVPVLGNFYQWDAIHNRFIPYDELNYVLGDFRVSNMIIPASDDRYWFFKEKEVGLFRIRFGKAELLYRFIPEAAGIELVEYNENIIEIAENTFLICMENGVAVLKIPEKQSNDIQAPVLSEIMINNSKNANQFKRKPDQTEIDLSTNENNIRISFNSGKPVGVKAYFKVMLKGLDQDWSNWDSRTQVDYNRLLPGKYTFCVKTLNGSGIETNEAKIDFKISKPWYLTFPAFLIYLALLVTFIYLLRINYKRRKWRHREQILKQENEKMRQLKEKAEAETIRLANEKLHSEMNVKDMELAKNTMSIIRKNEALIEIKEALEKQKEELGYRLPNKYFDSIIRLIDKNISSDHDWEIFETHFDQAHENFFRKLKSNYSDLTPNDLRLCAYLKLNLSSKEIAPLLNITIRGVEEKRYRLRKRLNMASDQSLTEFIMNF
ncbi:MAG: triple tyrosine motif-containing protein [Bacteroidales bacterium]